MTAVIPARRFLTYRARCSASTSLGAVPIFHLEQYMDPQAGTAPFFRDSGAPSDWATSLSGAERGRLRIWIGAIAATTCLVVLVGGVTRLTHSGLSIVDWRPLIGVVPPLSQAEWLESFSRYQQFPEYQQLYPFMTLSEYKRIFFWEYLHRALARAIGVVFLLPLAYFYFSGAVTRPLMRRLLALFALGVAQAVAGWLMVQSGLIDRPRVSHYRLAVHLVLAFIIFGMCIWLIRDLSPGKVRHTVKAKARRHVSGALLGFGALLALQIVWGAFVAGLKAGSMFNTFPLMGSSLVPSAFWTLTPGALNLVDHPAGVQWMHRLLGTLLLLMVVALTVLVHGAEMDRASQRWSTALLRLVAAQYAAGILTLILLVPISLAVGHQLLAMAVVGVWVCMLHHVRHLSATT